MSTAYVALHGCGDGGLTLHSDPADPLRFELAATGLPTETMWKTNLVFGDVNKDGVLDLAATSRVSDGAHVWLGDGKGGWTDGSQGLSVDNSCGGGVALGDVNRDALLDLVVADHCHGVYVYLGDGQGHWKAAAERLGPAIAKPPTGDEDEANDSYGFRGAEALALGDVDEDGNLDLVVGASFRGGLTVYVGDGSGSGWRETDSGSLPNAKNPEPDDEHHAGGSATEILLRDINNDGHVDVVAAHYHGPRVWWGDGEGHWRSRFQGLPSRDTGGRRIRRLAIADFNGDDRLDMVVANYVTGPAVFLQKGDGSWEEAPSVFLATQGGSRRFTRTVAAGDLDNDGDPDLLIAGMYSNVTPGEEYVALENKGYGLFVFRNDGKDGWTELPKTGLPSTGVKYPWAISLGDVNGDNHLDIAVATGGAESDEVDDDAHALPNMQVWINRTVPASPASSDARASPQLQ